jgi:hypothetical protein
LQTIKFHDESADDKFSLYSLTIDADLGFAQLVSATSYYDRKLNYLRDTTTYAHYWTASYCHDSAYTAADFPYYNFWSNPDTGNIVWYPVYCHGTTVDGDSYLASFLHAQQDKFTQEFRLSHQGDTVDWLVGLYYESSNDDWQSSFSGPTTGGDGSVSTYQDSMSLNYWEWRFSNLYGTPTTFPDATSHWYSQSATDWEQKAIFGGRSRPTALRRCRGPATKSPCATTAARCRTKWIINSDFPGRPSVTRWWWARAVRWN